MMLPACRGQWPKVTAVHNRTRLWMLALISMAGVFGAAQAQVVNRLTPPQLEPAAAAGTPTPTASRAPVTEYAPISPPAASVLTVVSPLQDQIAAELAFLPNETNDEYTARMRTRYDQVKKNAQRVDAEHAARMRALVQAWR
ncbi:hypothetical protein Xant_10035 [Xanthomonas cissicola]|uniref:Uncharacterized protein n=2 Tax=Xanthomonas cissicola TaxID=86186 RepID=A0ABX3LWS4_9XANT|nr:hypothetical protein Xant_10035 [Xanthomonas cissicola]